MQYQFTIPGRLPGLNEYTDACRGSKYGGGNMKKATERRIAYAIALALPGLRIGGPVRITYTWYEPDKRRDKDNVAFAKKFIQDALVRTKVLAGDGWKEIEGFADQFLVDTANPRVEVTIEEI